MIDFLVIGIGRMGGIHASNLAASRVRGARLKAVCDTDEEKREAFRKKHPGVETYKDYRKAVLRSGAEAVIVATPHYSHTEISEYCLVNGVKPLSEKPQNVTVREAPPTNAVGPGKSELFYGIMYNSLSYIHLPTPQTDAEFAVRLLL